MNGDHDYKDTIKKASDFVCPDEKAKEDRIDSDIAYETLSVSSSMGEFGAFENVANLMQLQLTQEMLYKLDPTQREDN